MHIRKAIHQDTTQIIAIYRKVALDRSRIGDTTYETSIQKHGFLLGLETPEEYAKLITDAHLFLVAEEDKHILGYIIADHREKYYDDAYKTWFDEKAKDLYYHDQHATTIGWVAVDPKVSTKGIASALEHEFEHMLKQEGIRYLYSIVNIAPVTNCPSLVFHTKMGFRRIAMGRPRPLFGLDNYAAVLFFKEL